MQEMTIAPPDSTPSDPRSTSPPRSAADGNIRARGERSDSRPPVADCGPPRAPAASRSGLPRHGARGGAYHRSGWRAGAFRRWRTLHQVWRHPRRRTGNKRTRQPRQSSLDIESAPPCCRADWWRDRIDAVRLRHQRTAPITGRRPARAACTCGDDGRMRR